LYDVVVDVDWADAGQFDGSLPGNGEATVEVSLNSQATSLPDGLHTGIVVFLNINTGKAIGHKDISVNVGVPVPVYEWDLETNPGWDMTGEWAFGQPTGQGGEFGLADPASGATGSNVFGINLNGDYSNVVGAAMTLTTDAIDCSGLSDVELRFARWLNTDYQPYVTQRLEVSPDGVNWTSIFDNGESEITDSSWSEQVHDISAIADGEVALRVRWSHHVSTAGAWAYSGWNVDDVAIWGVGGDVEPCDGDYTGDGMVDSSDILAVLGGWGQYNAEDILLIISNWGNDC
jgi:hypothetical protein